MLGRPGWRQSRPLLSGGPTLRGVGKLRRIALAASVVFVLTASTCGQAEVPDVVTSPAPSTAATSSSTVAAGESTTSTLPEGTPTTAPEPVFDGGCLAFWSEELVRDVAGAEFSLFQTSEDASTCAFAAETETVGLFFRAGTQRDFDLSRQGMSLVSPATDLPGVCDGAFYTSVSGPLVMEAFSAELGLIFNATTNTSAEDPVAVAAELLRASCEGPQFG